MKNNASFKLKMTNKLCFFQSFINETLPKKYGRRNTYSNTYLEFNTKTRMYFQVSARLVCKVNIAIRMALSMLLSPYCEDEALLISNI